MSGDLVKRIEAKRARVAVIGLGYVGLRLAVEFALQAFDVAAIDANQQRVEQVNRGESYIPDVRIGDLASVVASGTLQAATDYAAIETVDVVRSCARHRLTKASSQTQATSSRRSSLRFRMSGKGSCMC